MMESQSFLFISYRHPEQNQINENSDTIRVYSHIVPCENNSFESAHIPALLLPKLLTLDGGEIFKGQQERLVVIADMKMETIRNAIHN